MSTSEDIILLLVEDDDIDAEGVERALKHNNIANPIVRAHDGLEALELLETERFKNPYIILLDLNLPRIDGLGFLTKLREHSSHHSAVVFVLTTSNAEKDIIATYREHISGYFIKSEMGSDFADIAQLFESYYKMVKLPN